MGRILMNTDDVGTILRRRLRDVGLNQSDAAKLFGKSRAWASQELFSDPKKTLRRMLIDQPTRVTEFAKKLGWSDRDEMIAELDLFDNGPEETPKTHAERRGWELPEEEEPEIPETLLLAAQKYGHGENAPLSEKRWLLELADLDFREEPETPEDWLAIYSRLSKLINPKIQN